VRRVCWDRNLVRQLFTTEADTKLTRDSFMRLHQPFDRIRMLAAKPYTFASPDIITDRDGQFVGEMGLLNAFRSAGIADPNRIFVLTGEPGSGKSHLARWLCHMLEVDTDRAVIHIPRRINTLVEVLKHLADVAGMRLEQEPSSYLLEAPPAKVIRYLLAYLDMAVGPGTPAGQRMPLLARVALRTELEAVLGQQVARYQAARRVGTADGAELIMVPEEDFVRLSPGGTLPERAEAYSALRHHLTEALRKLTNLDRFDLRIEMERISQVFSEQGRRPILILEDITSFDLLHDDLLTFLLDEAAGHFDALVCWTTGYEKAYMRTYQLDRYTARLSLSDANMEVYALQGDGFRRMVKGYLDAVKPWCKPGMCELYDRCVPAFDGLYPFNRVALERIYENLIGSDQQHRRTPRNLLDRAVKSYLEIAEGHGPFPPLQQPPVVRDILYDEDLFRYRDSHPAFVALAAWYGKRNGNSIELKPDLADLLGVTPPAQISLSAEVFPLQVSDGGEPACAAAASVSGAGLKAQVLVQDRQEATQQVAASNKLKELRLEAQTWATTLHVPPHALDLIRSIHKLFGLFKLRFPVPLGHPHGPAAGVTYGKQQGESNLTLAGTKSKTTPIEQLIITPADPVALGRMDEVWQAALELHVTGSLPAHADLALLADWCAQRYAQYRHQILARLEGALGMNLPAWALAARWTLMAFRCGLTQPSYQQLLGAEVVCPLNRDLGVCGVGTDDVDSALLMLDQIVNGMFTVARGVFDAPQVLSLVRALTPKVFLPVLAGTPLTRIDTDLRVGIQVQLRDIARTVKHTAAVLLGRDIGERAAALKAEVDQALSGLGPEPTRLRTAVEEFHRAVGVAGRYELYDPHAGKAWAQGQAMLEDVRTLQPDLVRLAQSRPTTAWEYLEVAKVVDELRKEEGFSAAHAAAVLAGVAADRLNLPAQSSVADALYAAVDSLREGVRQSVMTVNVALDCLDIEARRIESALAQEAVGVLRNELLAGAS